MDLGFDEPLEMRDSPRADLGFDEPLECETHQGWTLGLTSLWRSKTPQG